LSLPRARSILALRQLPRGVPVRRGGASKEETEMAAFTRRLVLRGSLGLVAAGALARPYIANAAATTATVWWNQGFIPEEDAAFRKFVANYEKASGNTIEFSIVPFAALRQKEVSAVTSGVVPDAMEVADFSFAALNSWNDKLTDVTDVVDTQKSKFAETALVCSHYYNSAERKRAYYQVPMKGVPVPFHIWKSLVEKGGGKISELPKTWDAFLNYFKPVQENLRKEGMRNIYAFGYQLTTNGVDPGNTYNQWLFAYGGEGLVTPDGKLHTKDPKVREAAIKALENLTSSYKQGYVPPGVINWNDADDNNAFHSKLMVMDFDGTLSTPLALFHNKEEYNDILTYGLPLSNDGKEVPAYIGYFGGVIPKGAKNVAVAKEFLKYGIEPTVLNDYLKGGLGRWMLPMPALAKSDPFWLDSKDQHISTYTKMALFHPTIPIYEAYTPAWAQVDTEHVFMLGAFDVMKAGMAAPAAIDKAFARLEAIFAKYPIVA
jgi:multiple sugar transport system substrate-binding protein